MTAQRLKVRLTPKGGRDAVEGWIEHQGERVLKARVAAPPEDGKANASLIALMAKLLDLPKSRIQLVSGATSRLKTLEIEGSAASAACLASIGDAK